MAPSWSMPGPAAPQSLLGRDEEAGIVGTIERCGASLLGLAACDQLFQLGVPGWFSALTAVQGLLVLGVWRVVARGWVSVDLRSCILPFVWLGLWLNAVNRLGLGSHSGEELLAVVVFSSAGWCAMSVRGYFVMTAFGAACAVALGTYSHATLRWPVLFWAIPLGDVLGLLVLRQRWLIQRRWAAAEHDQDQTQRALQQALKTLQHSKERFRLLSESVPTGVFETDPSGRCVYANSAWRHILRLSLRDSVQGEWLEHIHPQERETIAAAWRQAMADEAAYEVECRLATPDGSTRWIQARINPVRSDAGLSFVGALEDITGRKQSEQELTRYAESLRETREHLANDSERLSQLVQELELAKAHAEEGTRAKSEFLANMSHEIRTPMTAVLGYTDVLLEQTADRPELQDSLQTVKRNAEFLLEIINDILDLSKIEAGKLEIEQVRCSPRQIAGDVLSLMQLRARNKRVRLELHADGPLPQSVDSDPTRLRQILINLVSNAVKFTPEGTVRLGLRYVPPSAATDGSGHLAFDVTDTGIGMSAEVLHKLFRPFTQADTSTTRQFGGTGLGLTICKRFAEMMGGDIAVSSTPGQGSTFTVTLPARNALGIAEQVSTGEPPASPANVAPHVASASSPPLACHILLAEDGPDNQKLIAFLLRKAGATVTIVENGQLALEQALAAAATPTPFDVILMDMQMPVLDGYNATRRLRIAGYTGPIVALTAHAMSGDRERCLTVGCTDYATKPIHRAALIETLHRVLQSAAATV
jgi:PAS domain S-box-containing protein